MNKIAFIGAGNMNAAIINGLVKQGIPPESIMVSNPSPEKRIKLQKTLGIQQTADNNKAVEFADYVILGVKPHLIKEVSQAFTEQVDISKKCFLSVAAGFTVQQLESVLGEKTAIVRTMPNTPSQLGLGMTGLFANQAISAEQKQQTELLMSAAGEIVWLNSEEQMDQLTSISGSGPAYFFLFMEAMQERAQAYGFSKEVSRLLVQQTALGAAEMVMQNQDLEIGELRANVTSKGGTTHAACSTFIDSGIHSLVDSAVTAAFDRAKEMTKQNS